MKKGRKWFAPLILAAGLLVAMLALQGCGPSAPAGTEIRIGVMAGQTGPAAEVVVALIEELENVFEYTNVVEGGIDGVKLSWKIVDNKGTPEGAVMAYRELRDTFDPHLYFAVEDYYLIEAKEMIEEDEAVIFTASAIDPRAFVPPGRFFGLAIPISDGFAGYVKWVLENHEGPGMPKIGVLHWDLPSGQQWRMAEAWVRKQGVELEVVQYSIATVDLKPELTRLRDAEVDYIWMLGVSLNATTAVKAYVGLGMTGTIPFTFNEYVEVNTLLEMTARASEGFYAYRSEVPYSDDSEAAELYSKIWKWAGKIGKWSDNRLLITLKSAITAAVRQAVADSGWENLSGPTIYAALNKLTEIDTMGNSQGFGYGPNKRLGVSTIKIARLTGGGTESVSDFIVLPRTFEGIDK